MQATKAGAGASGKASVALLLAVAVMASACGNRVLAPGPTARENVTLAYDSGRDVLVLFGGDDESAGNTADVWEWYVP
jgi:hypothetical protein